MTGLDRGGVVLHQVLSVRCLHVGVAWEPKKKQVAQDTSSISNSGGSRGGKNKGLADGAGLDVGIWFNFKLIFPQQAPLALPRA